VVRKIRQEIEVARKDIFERYDGEES